MIAKLTAALVLVMATGLFWGAGVALQRLSSAAKTRCGPIAIGIGVAAVVFVGGMLNLAHLAFAPALWTMTAMAAAVTIFELRRVNLPSTLPLSARLELIAAALAIGGVTLFTIATQLPPSVFNLHDDFEKYFSHPVRMLATGTLAGSPLSSLGSETLGAESLLQAFVLSALPIGYINGVDALFGLFVMMLIAARAGWRNFGWFPGAALGALLIAAIDPQYVNVSALYLGGALIATAVTLTSLATGDELAPAFIVGLVYACLIALKSTFALFVALHLPLVWIASSQQWKSWEKASKWAGETAVWTLIGLSPWLAMYLPEYFSHGSLGTATLPQGLEGTIHLFSFQHMFYGSGAGAYTVIAVLATVFAGWAIIPKRDGGPDDGSETSDWGLLAGAVAGLLSYMILVLVLAPSLTGYDASLRLAIPFLMGSSVIALLTAPPRLRGLSQPVSRGAHLTACLIVCALFVPSVRWRYREATRTGTILAFTPIEQNSRYLAYNAESLSGSRKQYLRQFQDMVPEHEPLLVWVNTPFLLDYGRNAIIDVDTGVGTPWAHIPPTVHYFLWQYSGEGVRGTRDFAEQLQGPGAQMRLIAARSLMLGNAMSQLSSRAQIIAHDDQTVLFHTTK